MRLLVGITLALSVFVVARTVKSTPCGSNPTDAAAMIGVEAAIATQCDRGTPRGAYRACVAAVVKAATGAAALRARCVPRVRRDVAHACPLPSRSVAEGGDAVDLYGYASMAVAAVQTQAREIAALQREVGSLRAAITPRGTGGCLVTATAPRRSKRARTSSGTSEPGHRE